MENRERDRVSQRTTPTEAGQLNRSVEEEKGRRENSGTSAEFGQQIGRSENLSEGGEMNRNRNQDELSNSNIGSESTRRSGQGSMGSSTGRSSGSGSMDSSGVTGNQSSSGGRKGDSSGSSGYGDSSQGRH